MDLLKIHTYICSWIVVEIHSCWWFVFEIHIQIFAIGLCWTPDSRLDVYRSWFNLQLGISVLQPFTMIAIVSHGFQTLICGWISTNPYLRLDAVHKLCLSNSVFACVWAGSRSNPFCGLLVLQIMSFLSNGFYIWSFFQSKTISQNVSTNQLLNQPIRVTVLILQKKGGWGPDQLFTQLFQGRWLD